MSELNGSDPLPGFDAVVLAGGSASRLGGADKPSLEIGGRTLLEAALDACAAAGRTVVVGPARPVTRARDRELLWAREEPVGAGPAAALAAGIAALADTSHPTTADQARFNSGRTSSRTSPQASVVVLAADLPFIDTQVIHSLWTTFTQSADTSASTHPDGAVAIDGSGRAQWLTACYRHSALLERIHSFPPEQLVGLSLRRLLAGLRLVEVAVPARAALDCDTWEQIEAARRMDAG